MKRNTRHRQEILQLLERAAGEHLSARQVCALLEADDVAIGTATVYRQLEGLVEEGMLRKYDTGAGNAACYEYVPSESACSDVDCFHCICVTCGALVHVNCSHLGLIRLHLEEEHGFQIDPLQTVFRGLCADCAGSTGPAHSAACVNPAGAG